MTDVVIDTPVAVESYLGMSDADIMNSSEPVFTTEAAEVLAADTTVDASEDADGEGADEGDADTGETADEAGEAGAAATDTGGDVDEVPEKPVSADKPVEKVADTELPTAVVDYEAEYKRLMAPFKANGRDITVNSIDEAVVLMQMGANYNKKMAALKPNLKLMKLLENNSMLTEEKISLMIELEKKNPDAINKLVKDSGLNPMDLDIETAGEYQPKIHKVDDREFDLDTVLEEIQETPTYSRTIEIVGKKWDGESKQVIADSPQLLKVINDHVKNGVYDLISSEVERSRLFGRLTGLSDIEAYRQVGDAMNARGGFNHLGSTQGTPANSVVLAPPKPAKVDATKLNEKRRAASSTKPANPGAGPAKEYNPLGLSDAEFAKIADARYS